MNKRILFLCFICVAQAISAQRSPIIYDTLDNWLTVNTPISLVIEKLGEPDSVGDVETWEATGLNYRYYRFGRYGMFLYSELDNNFETVFDIVIQGTSPFHTSHGVTVGDSKTDVMHKYEDCLDNVFSKESADVSIINSIYAGTFFFYDAGKVVKIEIGSLSE